MDKNKTKNFSKKDILKLSIVGILAGIISGLFSTGGGMILVPAFIYLLKLDNTKARGTSVFCILPMVVTSSFFYYKENFIDWKVAILCAIGGTVGGALCGVTEWNSGAAIGYCLGVGTLSVLPWAILSAKGNKLEEEAYKINVASINFGRIELDDLSIEPHADLLSFDNGNRAFGIGAKISF